MAAWIEQSRCPPRQEILKSCVYYETEDTTNDDGTVTAGTEFVLKNTYEGYDSGEYVSSYRDGVYEAEITRVGETEKAIRQNTADIEYLAIMGGIDL